jgi:hypothetical protein
MIIKMLLFSEKILYLIFLIELNFIISLKTIN